MNWATPEERRNLGQSRRKQVRRPENNQLNIKGRKTTPLKLLERVERGRVPALLKLKHQLMAQSPFGYFRGAAPVMAADLAVVPNTGTAAARSSPPGPFVYAISFSGFYLAMFLVLAAMILRPVAFKYRSKRPNGRWRSFGTGRCSSAASSRPWCSGSPWATSCRARPSAWTTRCARPTRGRC